MSVFGDTSAFYAHLVANDAAHADMSAAFATLISCGSVSFEFMRTHGLSTALAADPHFRAAGFDVLPA